MDNYYTNKNNKRINFKALTERDASKIAKILNDPPKLSEEVVNKLFNNASNKENKDN